MKSLFGFLMVVNIVVAFVDAGHGAIGWAMFSLLSAMICRAVYVRHE